MAVGILPLVDCTDGQDFHAFSHQYQYAQHHKCWSGKQAAPGSQCRLKPASSQLRDGDKASTAHPALPAASDFSWTSLGRIWGHLPTPP